MRICIFCGSSPGIDHIYAEAAKAAGALIAARGHHLVYGGARTGLMGIVADAVLAGGGEVDGVMPRHLIEKEINHTGLTRLAIVETMHERKMKMAEISDGFIALPGGIGTLEEIFEQWTWLVLGVHQKPCAFLNVNGYYDHLQAMMQHAVEQGFMKDAHVRTVLFASSPEKILDAFTDYKAPPARWTEKS